MTDLRVPEWMKIPETDIHGQIIHAAIMEGISPFKPKKIFMRLELDIDHNEYIVFVDLRFHGEPFDTQLIVNERTNAFNFADNPRGEIDRIAESLFRKLRFGKARHIDNPFIQLGDN